MEQEGLSCVDENNGDETLTDTIGHVDNNLNLPNGKAL